jgi:hypothetical protein
MCSKSSSGARPATSNGGGRDGASSFPVRGRRTWETRRVRAPGECGDAFPQLNLDRSRSKRGDRRRGGPRVLTSGNGGRRSAGRATEGGKGGAGSLQEDDVVLMVPLIGAERFCISGSTGGRAAAEERGSPALRSGSSGGGNWDWITR